MTIFEQAENLISESLIRKYFDVPGSAIYKGINGDELKTLCPYRDDKSIGSFFINLQTGLWRDYAETTGNDEGNFIQLVARKYNLSVSDAAEKIINESGQEIVNDRPFTKPQNNIIEKPAPIIELKPIDEKFLDDLEKYSHDKFFIEKHGEPVKVWPLRNENNEIWLVTIRYEKIIDGEIVKNVLPFYHDGKRWLNKNPYRNNRPLIGIHEALQNDLPIIVTEGEKCQSVKIEGYNNISWVGGTGQVRLSNWEKLEDRKVIIWPDNDEVGFKAAEYIKSKLSNAIILDIDKNKPKGWDIYDAEKEGVQIVNFINNHTIRNVDVLDKTISENIEMVTQNGNGISGKNKTIAPFRFLGFDESMKHYFIPNATKTVYSISKGGFTRIKLLELASLDFWLINFPKGKGVNFDTDLAFNWVISESQKKGMFQPENVRGAGFWYEKNEIVVNNGNYLANNKNIDISMNKQENHYVLSGKKIGELSGRESTETEGEKLLELVMTHGFENAFDAIKVLGWTLISPYGGILDWRPHLWITGPTQIGKSAMIHNLIKPLVGFYHGGTGADTTASIYRTAWKDAVPFICDEMEPKTKKDAERLDQTLQVIRNSSSNDSNSRSVCNKEGGVDIQFTRSMFCLASIVTYLPGESIENRFLVAKMKRKDIALKIKEAQSLLSTHLFDDFGIFRRRIFNRINDVIYNLKITREIILKKTADIRVADNLAPCLSAYYTIQRNGLIDTEEKINEWKEAIDEMFKLQTSEKIESDEETLLRTIFDTTIKFDKGEEMSIAEIIEKCSKSNVLDFAANALEINIRRYGIRFYNDDLGNKYLCVATKHDKLTDILKNTMYASNYKNVLERDLAFKEIKQMRFAGMTKQAILLDWEKIKEKYFNGE